MKFIGREKELGQLDALYHQPGFQMVVMYGRRRVGKTTLLNEFTRDKRSIFYMATRTSAGDNLAGLSRAILAGSGIGGMGASFSGYPEAFHSLTGMARSERLVVVLDEFPYLLEVVAGITSVLQKVIDQEWLRSGIMLILCGSSISMMEDEVLSEKSPLYGRRTAQMDIQPFDYRAAAEFLPDYSPENKALSYGITGGIPKYLSMLDPGKSLEDNIIALFFDDAGFFFEEPGNLLQQEFRNVAAYNTLLQAVAGGAVQVSEMSQKTHMDTALISQMLRRLLRIRIVRKDVPVPRQQNKRYTQYVLQDGMFRFWFAYVASAANAVERGYGAEYFRQRVKPSLHNYMGSEFEGICRQYLWNHLMDFSGELFITDVGKWRGMDAEKREPADIDVVGIDDSSKTAVAGECKFKREKMGARELATLKHRAGLIRPYQVKDFLLFSLSGFSPDLPAEPGVRLVTLEDMYR